MNPRFSPHPLFWLALAIASVIAAFSVWQDQRLDRIRPPPVAPLAAPAAPAAAPESLPVEAGLAPPPAASAVDAASAPVAGLVADSASTVWREIDPTAGRQVLRCVSKGRVTYRDLKAGCPEGASQKVTVFPTEGVGKPK